MKYVSSPHILPPKAELVRTSVPPLFVRNSFSYDTVEKKGYRRAIRLRIVLCFHSCPARPCDPFRPGFSKSSRQRWQPGGRLRQPLREWLFPAETALPARRSHGDTPAGTAFPNRVLGKRRLQTLSWRGAIPKGKNNFYAWKEKLFTYGKKNFYVQKEKLLRSVRKTFTGGKIHFYGWKGNVS